MKLAYEAGSTGGTMPCVFNAANEVAVAAFLRGAIGFLAIYEIIEKTMQKHPVQVVSSLEELVVADNWARGYARSLL